MAAWANFFAAQVSASAALLGLLFVSLSINLTKVLALQALPARAFTALLMLLVVLIVASLMLAPDVPMAVDGSEVLVVSLLAWAVVIRLELQTWNNTAADASHRRRLVFLTVLDQTAMALYVVASLAMFFMGPAALYWLVAAMLLSFLKATLDAWVLMVEINR
jgi:hypothetical protein